MANPAFRLERDEERRRIVITLSARSNGDVWTAAVAAVIVENAWRDPAI
jgi:hypothetical protein